MSAYINESYDCNSDNFNPDKMARAINKQHKDANMKANSDRMMQLTDISNGSKYLSGNLMPDNPAYGWLSQQGDFSSGLPELFSQQQQICDADSTFSSQTDNSFKNLGSMSENSYDLASNFSLLPSKIKKHLKNNSTHISLMKNKDDSTIMSHLKKCEQCKEKLLKIITSDGHIFTDLEDIQKYDSKESSGFKFPELKDLLIILLVGVIIIVILDIFFRRN